MNFPFSTQTGWLIAMVFATVLMMLFLSSCGCCGRGSSHVQAAPCRCCFEERALQGVRRTYPVNILAEKGRVVLLNLWATWCAPCRKEMPDLARLEKELGSDQFEVVAISVDRKGAEASAAFLKETGVDNLKLYIEPSTKIVNDVQSAGLPASILIDREGRELGRILGPADWASPEALALVKAALAQK